MGLVVRARALGPLPNGDRGARGGFNSGQGRIVSPGHKGDILAPDERLEGGRGLKGDKVLGPDEVGDLVGDEDVLVDGHLLRYGQAVGEVVGKVLEGLLDPRVEHLLPGLEPPEGEDKQSHHYENQCCGSGMLYSGSGSRQ